MGHLRIILVGAHRCRTNSVVGGRSEWRRGRCTSQVAANAKADQPVSVHHREAAMDWPASAAQHPGSCASGRMSPAPHSLAAAAVPCDSDRCRLALVKTLDCLISLQIAAGSVGGYVGWRARFGWPAGCDQTSGPNPSTPASLASPKNAWPAVADPFSIAPPKSCHVPHVHIC